MCVCVCWHVKVWWRSLTHDFWVPAECRTSDIDIDTCKTLIWHLPSLQILKSTLFLNPATSTIFTYLLNKLLWRYVIPNAFLQHHAYPLFKDVRSSIGHNFWAFQCLKCETEFTKMYSQQCIIALFWIFHHLPIFLCTYCITGGQALNVTIEPVLWNFLIYLIRY